MLATCFLFTCCPRFLSAWGDSETRAREMHYDLAGSIVVTPDRNVLRRERDDFAAHLDFSVVIGHDRRAVPWLTTIRIVGIATCLSKQSVTITGTNY
jgi:hypothetical protein